MGPSESKIKLGIAVATSGFVAGTSAASAQPVRWTTYTIPETTTSVDLPASIFAEAAGKPDGRGQRFRTADGRADLTIQAVPNLSNDSPAAFLAKKRPPSHIQYKRVTTRFFAVSRYKGDKVASEEHDWDDIVARISLSLRGG